VFRRTSPGAPSLFGRFRVFFTYLNYEEIARAFLDAVAKDITASGGAAGTAEVDALDEQAVNKHADSAVAKSGGIDIALNAVGILHVQGWCQATCVRARRKDPSRTPPTGTDR
jgi:NAD(P)-dependent dehydrogenase (short-subunit alcohol dehydrogenase family)